MIHDMIGGGAPLNFKVVGGTSAPAAPKENTIWVNTDVEITGWHFCAEEPNVAEGTVWITTGTSSAAEFNALKKNGIQVYPMSAKQYISGAWADKEAKTYQSGAWVDWITYLYDKGNQFTTLTGGWAAYGDRANVTFEDQYMLLQLQSGYNEQTAAAHTVNKIDFTGISTLYFYIDERTSDDIADSSKISKYGAVGISDSPDIRNNGWVAYTQVLKSSAGTLYTVDVSQYSGEYYICVHNAINSGGHMKCSAVYGK